MNVCDLERIYDAHAGGVFRYFAAFAKSEADAKDLLQDFFIKLAQARPPALRDEKAWLFRLAHHLAVDWWRRRERRGNYEGQALETVPELPQAAENPDAALLSRRLADAMRRLPDEQRTVVQLKLWEGLTFDEIAVVQGIPPNTASSRYRYALEKLRLLLRPIYEELV